MKGRAIESKIQWWKATLAVVFFLSMILVGIFGISRMLDRSQENRSAGIVDAAGGVTQTDLKHAEELPARPPTLWGMVDHTDGNSVYVIQLPPLDQIIAQKGADLGPTYEVVVTHQTVLYKDVTSGPAIDGIVYEKVAPGELEEIENGNLVKVWGEKRGDRIVAEIFKYDNHTQLVTPSGPIN